MTKVSESISESNTESTSIPKLGQFVQGTTGVCYAALAEMRYLLTRVSNDYLTQTNLSLGALENTTNVLVKADQDQGETEFWGYFASGLASLLGGLCSFGVSAWSLKSGFNSSDIEDAQADLEGAKSYQDELETMEYQENANGAGNGPDLNAETKTKIDALLNKETFYERDEGAVTSSKPSGTEIDTMKAARGDRETLTNLKNKYAEKVVSKQKTLELVQTRAYQRVAAYTTAAQAINSVLTGAGNIGLGSAQWVGSGYKATADAASAALSVGQSLMSQYTGNVSTYFSDAQDINQEIESINNANIMQG